MIPPLILTSQKRHSTFPDMMQQEVQISMYTTFLPKLKSQPEKVYRSNYQYRKQKGQRNILNETKAIQVAKSRI